MFRFSKLYELIFILTVLFSCSSENGSRRQTTEWMKPNGKIKALSTIAMVDDLVKQIGRDFVDSISLIKGELDPHTYQIVKGDDEKLAFADLIFYSGLGLEHGPSLQAFLLNNPKSIGIADRLMKENPSFLIYHNGMPDPHIWMDISMWAKTIPYIVEALSIKDPLHADFYKKNGEMLLNEMMVVHQEVKNELQTIPEGKRYLVTSHDAFNYFTKAYLAAEGEHESLWRNRFAAPEGLAPESQISAVDIQAIITHLDQYKIRVLFPESNVNRDSIKKIVIAAKQKGMDVIMAERSLYADAMGKPGSEGDTYLKMIQYNAKIISENLKKNGG